MPDPPLAQIRQNLHAPCQPIRTLFSGIFESGDSPRTLIRLCFPARKPGEEYGILICLTPRFFSCELAEGPETTVLHRAMWTLSRKLGSRAYAFLRCRGAEFRWVDLRDFLAGARMGREYSCFAAAGVDGTLDTVPHDQLFRPFATNGAGRFTCRFRNTWLTARAFQLHLLLGCLLSDLRRLAMVPPQ